MSAIANATSLLTTIAALESQLVALKSSISGGESFATPAKKVKKMKDPDAPKKEANVWIKFTMRVGNLLKAACAEASEAEKEHFKGPATMVKQFCTVLKGQKPYEAWMDSEVLEAFESWERPPIAPRTKKSPDSSAAPSASASDAGSVAGDSDSSAKKERKKPAPKSEEEKAAINAKRAATLAAKKIAATEMKVDTVISEITELVSPEPAAAVAPVAKPAAFKAKKVVEKYTMEQLTDFNEQNIDGTDYGVNARGDVIDSDLKYVGAYDTATKAIKRDAAAPADWDAIVKML
jgi:hypothetical protein